MKARVLSGSKKRIAATVARMSGQVREAVVFVEEPAPPAPAESGEDIFAEMAPHTVKAGGADYSRDALYTRMEGE